MLQFLSKKEYTGKCERLKINTITLNWFRLNRCLDLCCKQPTNHLSHPSLWSAAAPVWNQPVSRCKFPSIILRITSGTLVRGCEGTCSALPGHCVSVNVGYLWGQSSTGLVRSKQVWDSCMYACMSEMWITQELRSWLYFKLFYHVCYKTVIVAEMKRQTCKHQSQTQCLCIFLFSLLDVFNHITYLLLCCPQV